LDGDEDDSVADESTSDADDSEVEEEWHGIDPDDMDSSEEDEQDEQDTPIAKPQPGNYSFKHPFIVFKKYWQVPLTSRPIFEIGPEMKPTQKS
jgi:hypothetical protein